VLLTRRHQYGDFNCWQSSSPWPPEASGRASLDVPTFQDIREAANISESV